MSFRSFVSTSSPLSYRPLGATKAPFDMKKHLKPGDIIRTTGFGSSIRGVFVRYINQNSLRAQWDTVATELNYPISGCVFVEAQGAAR
jgi:hypothetical protein